jgi:hypothetical protein
VPCLSVCISSSVKSYCFLPSTRIPKHSTTCRRFGVYSVESDAAIVLMLRRFATSPDIPSIGLSEDRYRPADSTRRDMPRYASTCSDLLVTGLNEAGCCPSLSEDVVGLYSVQPYRVVILVFLCFAKGSRSSSSASLRRIANPHLFNEADCCFPLSPDIPLVCSTEPYHVIVLVLWCSAIGRSRR